ncbi:hypothetical protein OH76DRAFT_459057 [Lentinus brumalis]|uniref:Uncharacterized protein n=1 Tax=Lentinus brumalis TaxID=2498619 RepID=A0A371DDE8_9APHY|nr:hypothetical protein OH76DRAFT_459057 [Polyporus brumalis]
MWLSVYAGYELTNRPHWHRLIGDSAALTTRVFAVYGILMRSQKPSTRNRTARASWGSLLQIQLIQLSR